MKYANLILLAALVLQTTGCAGSQAALQSEVDRLKQQNQKLREQNASLAARLEKVEKQIAGDDIRVSITPETSPGKIRLTVQSDGNIVLEGEAVALDDLPGRLTKVYQGNRETVVVLKTQAGVPYQRVVEVLDVISAVGFDRLVMDTGEKDGPEASD